MKMKRQATGWVINYLLKYLLKYIGLVPEYTKRSPIRRQTNQSEQNFIGHFKNNIGTVYNYMKICSTSLANREMQIKTNMRYYFILRWL